MSLLLGIDTGGTYTDAALLDAATRAVVASAKAPTTHHNLIIGVDEAIGNVLDASGCDPIEISLISISTTLATNALVEGTGEPACLIAIGFADNELESAGITGALAPGDVVVSIAGGHDAHGNEHVLATEVAQAALGAIEQQVSAGGRFGGFAVASQFSVRNPAHELAVSAAVRESTGAPVTCSHRLSAKLGGPRRALTALLNARLIGMIAALIDAVETSAGDRGLAAPIMVVRGDGSLVSAAFAAERPIETVLSGPAASVIGAMHLSDATEAVVADIGGTTTDVAVVRNRRPRRTEQGAVVAGHRTMVEAVDMMTWGLGGDSEVRVDSGPTAPTTGPLVLGPQRAIPLCRLAMAHGDLVHRLLDRALNDTTLSATEARMVVATGVGADEALPGDEREAAILADLAQGPQPERQVAGNALKQRALERLRNRGLVRIATMTPTDAAHVVGLMDQHDSSAARKIADLVARQQDGRGASIAADGIELATMVIDALAQRSAEAVLAASLAADGFSVGAQGVDPARDPLVQAVLGNRAALSSSGAFTRVDVGLSEPLVALGASAASYYPAVAHLVDAQLVVPPHADVANAVGAAVGKVIVRLQLAVTQPRKGQFKVHHGEQQSFGTIEGAREHGATVLTAEILAAAEHAGADSPVVEVFWDETTAMVDGKAVFVEGTLLIEASGEPGLGNASDQPS